MTRARLLAAAVIVWALTAGLFGGLWWLLDGLRRFDVSDWWDVGIALAIQAVALSWVLGQLWVGLRREERERKR